MDQHDARTGIFGHLKLDGIPRCAAARAPLDPVLQLVAHLRQGFVPGRGRHFNLASGRSGVPGQPFAIG